VALSRSHYDAQLHSDDKGKLAHMQDGEMSTARRPCSPPTPAR
jgi:hypothetical protein